MYDKSTDTIEPNGKNLKNTPSKIKDKLRMSITHYKNS